MVDRKWMNLSKRVQRIKKRTRGERTGSDPIENSEQGKRKKRTRGGE